MYTTIICMTQSAGAAEYTDCFSAEGWDSSNECPGYDTKQSDNEAPVMLETWGMGSTIWLPLLPDRVLSIAQIEVNSVLMLNWNVWNRTVLNLTVCKQKLHLW